MKEFVQKIIAKWAREIWQKDKPTVIAITGSIAKTSTKEAIFGVMDAGFPGKVFATPGNLNNEFGMPLAILGFRKSAKSYQYIGILILGWFRKTFHRKKYDWWILEMGADRPGDILYLTEIVKPNAAIITAVGPSHLELLKTIEGVWEEKSTLVRSVESNGTVFLNGNDVLVKKMAEVAKAAVVFYLPEVDQIAESAAREVGRYFGVGDDKIEEALRGLKNLSGRMKIIEGKEGSILIDDTYNANPLSMKSALYLLDKLAREKGKTRRVAILGDMLDLGQYSEEEHRKLSSLAREYADYVIGIGPNMKIVDTDEWYIDSEIENLDLLNNLTSNDIILLKGSRGIHMEKLLDKFRKV
jgi:UDP-N-acetylmuramoyl-tripeptide--D-alanyl-D-alanine ligase